MSAGGEHSLAIKTNGTLWAWGKGTNGELGIGEDSEVNETGGRSSPVQVGSDTWTYVANGYNGNSAAGYSLGIKTNGTMWAWGNNSNGHLGLGDTTNRDSPVQIGSDTWNRLFTGGLHAIKTAS